ncbi:TetR/AcrR family transcriptional regulator [Nocardia sp. FBN12]|uniref:TetR/AcrR family transcriptional regulator n=1 Tax=Nocardia sp. FBN12 TaxID=3419766 RepID=UPI003D0277E0
MQSAHILATAGSIFAARGYHATTMDDVACRVGVSKPVIYKHFSCKLDLYLAILRRHIDTLVTKIRSAMHSNEDNRTKLSAAVNAFFDFAENGVTGFALLFDTHVADEPSVQWHLRQLTTGCTEAVAEVVAASGLDTKRAQLVAAMLVGMSQSAARDWHAGRFPISKYDAVDLIVTLCWSGLSRTRSRTSAPA